MPEATTSSSVNEPAKDEMPTMGFLEHLEELRRRIIYSIIAVAGVVGLFVASPVVLYQVWLFIAPGLYRNEKRYVLPFMVSTVSLFLAGGYFGYKLVYPQALRFLIEFSKQFTPMITIEEYSSLFLTIIVGMGVIFEMPILA